MTRAYVSQKLTPSTCLPPCGHRRAFHLVIVQSGARFCRKLQIAGTAFESEGMESLRKIVTDLWQVGQRLPVSYPAQISPGLELFSFDHNAESHRWQQQMHND
jgi:hypothetical protein